MVLPPRLRKDIKPKLTLDDYQAELIDRLWSDLRFGSFAFLTATTGSGKSVICRALCHLLKGKTLKGVLTLVPQNQIKESWIGERTITFPPIESWAFTPNETLKIEKKDWHSKQAKNKSVKKDLKDWLHNCLEKFFAFVATQQGFSLGVNNGDPDFLPEDLTGYLLIVDEAHHVSDDNELGAAVQKWVDRGGKVLYVTATPFRNHGTLPYPENLIHASRPLAVHISSGKYSPEFIHLNSKQLSYAAKTDQHLSGDVMPKGDREILVKEIVELWIKDHRPKVVIIVPAKGSVAWSKDLQTLLEKAGARVHNAVGRGCGKKSAIQDLLKEEQAVTRYEDSKVDVILACKRFDEGSDWPLCSHIYNMGMPSSFLLILQRLGRALRYKGGHPDSNRPGIKGYPEKYRNEAHMTFITPRRSDTAWASFETKHRDHAFLVACFMNEAETGFSYLGDIKHMFDDPNRPRSGNKPVNRQIWLAICSALDMEIREGQDLYIGIKQACLHMGKSKPTDDELGGWLQSHMKWSKERAHLALRARNLRQNLKNPKVIQALDARVSRAWKGIQDGGLRVIRKILWDVFDNEADHLIRDNEALFQEAQRDLACMTKFTGQGAKAIESRMRMRLPVGFTPREMYDASVAYHLDNDEKPDPSLDASSYFDLVEGSVSWGMIKSRWVNTEGIEELVKTFPKPESK